MPSGGRLAAKVEGYIAVRVGVLFRSAEHDVSRTLSKEATDALRKKARQKLSGYIVHLTARDLDGARRELRGEVVKLKSSGRPWDHVKEVRQAQRGLETKIQSIKRRLTHPSTSVDQRAALEIELGEASRLLDHSRLFVPR